MEYADVKQRIRALKARDRAIRPTLTAYIVLEIAKWGSIALIFYIAYRCVESIFYTVVGYLSQFI